MATFDPYAQNYRDILKKELRLFGEEPEYFAELKVRTLKRFLDSNGAFQRDKNLVKIAEVGCGIGGLTKFWSLLERPTQNFGLDLSLESLKQALQIQFKNSKNFFVNGDACHLPFQEGKFQVICFAGVLHHIPMEKHHLLFKECYRALAHGGVVAIFEHNPYNPLTRWVIRHIEFDKEAHLISRSAMVQSLLYAGFQIGAKEYTTFFPRFLSFLRKLEPKLSQCPIGAQYFIAGVKPKLKPA